ncbi:hypothetical protein G7046_g3497 [Stylonectria norvegica]|nr:hypothetical protein G7046_g3497 [Stylonectria norvegica]
MSSAPRTIAIIGSAIAGPTLALQILSNSVLRSAFRPILFDQTPPPGVEDKSHRNRAGATVGLFANGLYPLYRLGLEDAIRQRGFECGSLMTWNSDYSGTSERLSTQANAMWSSDLQTGVIYFERHALQALLVERVKELGGAVSWEKKAVDFHSLHNGQTRIDFADGTNESADLLVGADGGYSSVRSIILNQRNVATAEARWLPDFMGLTGFYGVSTGTKADEATAKFGDSHCIWLERGFLASGPCPGGRIRWDLIIPEENPPSSSSPLQTSHAATADAEAWQSTIVPSQYPNASTVETLRRHKAVAHPYSGTFEALLNSADRIIRTPLRQRVWKKDEIQHGNTVLLGDAARLMLPTSGQGTGFAIEDATVLAKMLLKHVSSTQTPYSMRTALEDYAQLRVPRSTKMASISSLAATWGTSSSWYWKAIRYYGSKWQPDSLEARKKGKDPWPFNERLDVDD